MSEETAVPPQPVNGKVITEHACTHAIPTAVLPPLSNIVEPVISDGLTSKLVTKVAIKAGQVVYPLVNLQLHATKRYTSLQLAENMNCELNSNLVYMNHSCDPSVNVDTTFRLVIANRDLEAGDEVTFFYPSTEWEMEQPFECWCGGKNCVREVKGAKHLTKEQLGNYFVNQHILRLKEQQLQN